MKHGLTALILIGVLAACGGSSPDSSTATTDIQAPTDTTNTTDPDVSTTVEASTAPSTDGADQASDSAQGDTSGGIVIDSLDAIPTECRQLMGDFLEEIEPVVSAVDWQSATLADMEELSVSINESSARLDEEMVGAGCDQYEFGANDDQGFEFAIDIAKEMAPGTLGWLEFVRSLSTDFATTPDGTSTEASGVPTDCDGAIAYIADIVDATDTMNDIQVAELMNITTAMTTIQTECPIEQSTAFFEDPAVVAFFSG
jgi:hypothetical protein